MPEPRPAISKSPRTLIQGGASLSLLVVEGMRVMARGEGVTTEEACELVSAVLPVTSPYDPDVKADPTPDQAKGIFRRRGPTLLDQCVYLMEQMFMESLNGVLCQVDDAEDGRSGSCTRCERMWDDLKALMARYDAGER